MVCCIVVVAVRDALPSVMSSSISVVVVLAAVVVVRHVSSVPSVELVVVVDLVVC